MNLSEFKQELIEDVLIEATSSSDGIVNSFVRLTSEMMLNEELIDGFEPCFYQDTGKNRRLIRVDGYYFDKLDNQLILFIADYQGETDLIAISKSEAVNTMNRAKAFFEEAKYNNLISKVDKSWPIYDLMSTINENKIDIRRVRILLLTDKLMSSRISKIDDDVKNDVTFEYQIWDINKLNQISLIGKEVEELEVDFGDYIPTGLPCLSASIIAEKNIESYLCVINGNTLADLYDKYGSRLLEGNVRSFLSMTVKVNKKIRETILNEPEMFFSYNNGISATATSVEFYDKEKSKIKSIKNLQIVNGGQTTATISTTRFKDKVSLKDVYVQMKLTTINSDQSDMIIPIISRSSNSQNKISEADFFSTHSFHVRMEQHSQRIFAPAVNGIQYGTHWFYERARGQYNQKQLKLSKADKNKFLLTNPKKQLITKTDLAKYYNSWYQKPHEVSKGAQSNFVEFANGITVKWEKNESVFHQDFFKFAVSLAILFKSTERIVSNQDWYKNSYRANIVTYSIAALSYLLKRDFKEYRLNFSKIWSEQNIGSDIEETVVFLSKYVYEYITDDSRPIINVTQWCKNPLCWNKLQEKLSNVKLNEKVIKFLITKTAEAEVNSEARTVQKIDNEFELVNYVVTKSVSYWEEIIRWGTDRKKLLPNDILDLKATLKISSGRIPEPFQCKRIILIEERLLKEGFK